MYTHFKQRTYRHHRFTRQSIITPLIVCAVAPLNERREFHCERVPKDVGD